MTYEEITREYASYLDRLGITYHNRHGFSVRFNLKNADFAFVDVLSVNGKLEVFDYFGTCYTGIRAAKKLAKSLQERFPDYHIWVEKYTAFEIDVAQDFEFTTLEDLHRRVIQLASVVDEGAGIGKEMLGDSFER